MFTAAEFFGGTAPKFLTICLQIWVTHEHAAKLGVDQLSDL